MSDELTASTNKGQNITLDGITLPFDLNISISGSIKITSNSETQSTLDKFLSFFQINTRTPETSTIERTENVEADEPAELSVKISDDLIDPVFAPAPKWKTAGKVRWREEAGNLIVRYRSDEWTTTWDNMKKLSEIPDNKRVEKIRAVLGGKFTNNRRTALNMFAKKLIEGEIKLPVDPETELENNFKLFQEEVDQDAVFRPMVSPFFSTHPDENYGKVEGTMEG